MSALWGMLSSLPVYRTFESGLPRKRDTALESAANRQAGKHALRRLPKSKMRPMPAVRQKDAGVSLCLRHLPSLLMTLKLSTLAIVLGLAVGLPQIYGIMQPGKFAASVRKFPRNVPVGIGLMLVATVWFLWNLHLESISEFEKMKPYLFAGFAAVGIGSCVFVQDLLAVRGLAVVFLLLGKLMVDTGRPMLEVTPWTLVIQTWAYALVVAGIWFTVSPFRLRNLLEWATANEKRVRVGSVIRLAFGLFVAALGLTVF
jgi:hypothetical protein